jgi:carboxyl-terminal processing protease
LTIKNIGKGRSFDTSASLRNLAGDGLLLHDGRFDGISLMPGEARKVAFTFDIQPLLSESEAKVELAIRDEELREGVLEKVRIPIQDPVAVVASAGAARPKGASADLFGAADGGARPFARLSAGAAAAVAGTAGAFTKIALGDGRFAFARSAELTTAGSAPAVVALEEGMAHAPPALEIPQLQLVSRETHTPIRVTATDDAQLLDAYIFVGVRKVFYRSNRDGPDPRKMSFDADLPLRPGVNVVTVVARENPDTTSRRTFIVRRDGPGGELLATPKTDDELSETASGDEE